MAQNAKQKLGKTGEDIATDYLIENKYRIIERNWQTKWGEIDIVAVKKKVLIFVEVKTLNKNKTFFPEDEIAPKKQKQLLKITQIYLSKHKIPLSTPRQIDVIAIEKSETDPPIIRHHQNALVDFS